MPLKTKIIGILAALLLLAAAGGLLRVVKPLVSSEKIAVVYAEGEDFWGDAEVYQRLFRRNPLYVFVPNVSSVSQWWVIDRENMRVYEAKTPRSLFSLRYVLRSDPWGTPLDSPGKMKEWRWQFTSGGVSFAGEDFTFVGRMQK